MAKYKKKAIAIGETIREFSGEMAKKMVLNIEKEWSGETPWSLFDSLMAECNELIDAIGANKPEKEVTAECADVANFAMMIAKVYVQKEGGR